MKTRAMVACCATCFSIVASGGIASAHANLVSCTIHNNQVFRAGQTPKSVTGTFAENLDPAKSWMAIFEGQADHGLVTEQQHSHVNFRNPHQMVLPLPAKMNKEKYYLIWYTHSSEDSHFAAGVVYFQVR